MSRGDEELRALERAAASGDPAAKATLHVARARRGLPLLPDEWGTLGDWEPGWGDFYAERWYFPNGWGVMVSTNGFVGRDDAGIVAG